MVAAAGAAAETVIDELGEGEEVVNERLDDRRSGRGDELDLGVGRIDGNAAQKLGHGGGRDGEDAVRGLDVAFADVKR